MGMRFVLVRAGVPTKNGNIYTSEALSKLRDDLLEKKVITLRDAKGSYEAKLLFAYVDQDALMVEVETRFEG